VSIGDAVALNRLCSYPFV